MNGDDGNKGPGDRVIVPPALPLRITDGLNVTDTTVPGLPLT